MTPTQQAEAWKVKYGEGALAVAEEFVNFRVQPIEYFIEVLSISNSKKEDEFSLFQKEGSTWN